MFGYLMYKLYLSTIKHQHCNSYKKLLNPVILYENSHKTKEVLTLLNSLLEREGWLQLIFRQRHSKSQLHAYAHMSKSSLKT